MTSPYLDNDSEELSDQRVLDIASRVETRELVPCRHVGYSEKTIYINGERIGDQAPSEILQLADSRSITQSSLKALNSNW